MNYLANLQQALSFFRKNGGSSRGLAPNESGETMPGMLWAERMADRMGGGANDPPDFFGEAPNVLHQYQAPAQFDAGPMPRRNQQPRNVLSMMGGRRGY